MQTRRDIFCSDKNMCRWYKIDKKYSLTQSLSECISHAIHVTPRPLSFLLSGTCMSDQGTSNVGLDRHHHRLDVAGFTSPRAS
jgi:hypothetical protein